MKKLLSLIGLLLLADRALPGVLDGESGDDHQDVPHAPVPIGFDHHPGQPRVEGEPGQHSPHRGQPAACPLPLGVHGSQFVEKGDAETAGRYLADGHQFWNAGIFVLRASAWMAALGRFSMAASAWPLST